MKTIMKIQPSGVDAPPITTALIIATLYTMMAVIYIIVSGRIAMKFAANSQQLARIEFIKGVVFIVLTGLVIFLLVLYRERTIRRKDILLIQNDRRSVIGLCSATVAHDINNFLMALMGLVKDLKSREKGDESLSTLRAEIEASIEKLTKLSKSLASAGKQDEAKTFDRVDVHPRVKNVVELLGKHPDLRQRNVKITGSSSALMNVDVPLFEQALGNLIINSGQATGKGGQIEVELRPEEGRVVLEVHDDGPGIPTELAEKMFEVGYTTKDNGSGLGMLSVRAFVASCKGEVAISQSHLGGATFQIYIPVEEQSPHRTKENAG